MIKSVRAIGKLLLVFIFSSSFAWAYIVPSSFVIKNVAKRAAGARNLRIKTLMSAYDGQKSYGPVLKETAFIDFPSRIVKSRITDETGRELYTFERRIDPDKAPLGGLVLIENQVERLASALKSHGIPVKTDSDLKNYSNEEERRKAEISYIDRWKNLAAWVFGEKSGPQLWVEKDSFHPLRVVLKENSTEIQYEKYMYAREYSFPKIIFIYPRGISGGNAIRVDITDVIVNGEVGDFKNFNSLGYTDLGNASSSEVRDQIALFYQYYR